MTQLLIKNKVYYIKGDGNCVKTAFSNMCLSIHDDGSKKRLLLIHEMPLSISQIFNQFGMTKSYHTPVISYENEMLNGFIYKIFEDIDPEMKFYFTVSFFL